MLNARGARRMQRSVNDKCFKGCNLISVTGKTILKWENMRVTGGDFSFCNNENNNVLLLRGNEKRVFCARVGALEKRHTQHRLFLDA